MSAPTTTRAAGGVQLPVVSEPLGLKRALRTLAEEHPGRAAELLTHPDEVAAHLWERWRADLERAGMSDDKFLSVLADYRQELWYWLWGNRTWAQCSQGLAGRLTRRAGRQPQNPPADASRPPALLRGE
jgi:hypothetical protein